MNLRTDGRANVDPYSFKVQQGTVDEAFGSATVTFGEHDT